MAKYKEKPIFVEAVQYNGHNIDTIWEAFGADKVYGPTEKNPDWLIIETFYEDFERANIGDWIIKLKEGALEVINPEDFDNTYELVQE